MRRTDHWGPTDCGVSEYDREASITGRPRLTGGLLRHEKKVTKKLE
jgi:hypothetical protein